ncbi:MAG: hypothetical protein HDR15_01765 [Lachnospiraceae bacterium]|nr:hypothetical protein [Lachnospiraceae bacterium]
MRITTQMLNEAARKAGVPLHTTSMLSYVQDKGKTNSLPYGLSAENEKESLRKTEAYEKQEDAAKRLEQTAKELSAQGEDSIYGQTENKEELAEKVMELVKQYNEVLSGFQGSTGLLDTFYRQNLKSLVTEQKDVLQKLGITTDKNGQLSVNGRTLHDADRETLEKALSGKDGFADSLSFLAAKIADYAASNQQSTQSTYQSNGSAAQAAMRYTNKYDAWG